MNYKGKNKRIRGQSLVEFALVLPILLMLLLGLLDFGRAFFTMIALRDAADEGATYAAIRPSDVSGVQLRTVEASTHLTHFQASDVSVIYPSTIAPGAPITVTVTYVLELYTPFVAGMLEDDQLVLTGRATQPIITVR